jgi:hypothetical protein
LSVLERIPAFPGRGHLKKYIPVTAMDNFKIEYRGKLPYNTSNLLSSPCAQPHKLLAMFNERVNRTIRNLSISMQGSITIA